MRKIVRFAAALTAAICVFGALAQPVKADVPVSAPSVGTTLQNVTYGFNPGKIILPYGAMLAPDGMGNWVLAFLDTSVAVLNAKTGFVPLANGFTVGLTNEGIVYYKNINNIPIKVTYNLGNCIARVDAGNTIAFFRNGSILFQKVTNFGSTYTVETYNENGAILKNEVHDLSGRLLAVDDYVRTPGMIVRTFYDATGNPTGFLPYYGDAKPAYY